VSWQRIEPFGSRRAWYDQATARSQCTRTASSQGTT